jgi:hypothetical protein
MHLVRTARRLGAIIIITGGISPFVAVLTTNSGVRSAQSPMRTTLDFQASRPSCDARAAQYRRALQTLAGFPTDQFL